MNSFLSCPNCDDDLNLGPVEVVQDCTAYDQVFSQVCGVILLPNSADLPADWTDPAEWALAIDNSITGTAKGRYLIGEGEIDEPDEDIDDYPYRQRRVSNRLYTVELTIKNLSLIQYDFLRQLQCGWVRFRFWIETVGGRLFGGETGIKPLLVGVSFIYSGGRDDREAAVLTLQYESDGDPPRTDITGLADAVAQSVTLYTAFGPVDAGDEAFGPAPGGDEVFGYAE